METKQEQEKPTVPPDLSTAINALLHHMFQG